MWVAEELQYFMRLESSYKSRLWFVLYSKSNVKLARLGLAFDFLDTAVLEEANKSSREEEDPVEPGTNGAGGGGNRQQWG